MKNLENKANEIKNERGENRNTALRIGGFLLDLLLYITDKLQLKIVNGLQISKTTNTSENSEVVVKFDEITKKFDFDFKIKNGNSPQINDQGNWIIGDVDTNVYAGGTTYTHDTNFKTVSFNKSNTQLSPEILNISTKKVTEFSTGLYSVQKLEVYLSKKAGGVIAMSTNEQISSIALNLIRSLGGYIPVEGDSFCYKITDTNYSNDEFVIPIVFSSTPKAIIPVITEDGMLSFDYATNEIMEMPDPVKVIPSVSLNPEGKLEINGSVQNTSLVGPQGPQGAVGAKGEVGPQGLQGRTPSIALNNEGKLVVDSVAQSMSLVGPQGPQGTVGAKGEVGPQGPQGRTPSIALNNEGKLVVDSVTQSMSLVGPQGPQGTVGAKGEVGPQGLQGAVGVKGEVGPQGLQGAVGAKGNTGNTWKPVISNGSISYILDSSVVSPETLNVNQLITNKIAVPASTQNVSIGMCNATSGVSKNYLYSEVRSSFASELCLSPPSQDNESTIYHLFKNTTNLAQGILTLTFSSGMGLIAPTRSIQLGANEYVELSFYKSSVLGKTILTVSEILKAK